MLRDLAKLPVRLRELIDLGNGLTHAAELGVLFILMASNWPTSRKFLISLSWDKMSKKRPRCCTRVETCLELVGLS